MGGAWMRGQGCFAWVMAQSRCAEPTLPRGLRIWAIGLLCAAGALLFASPSAHAAACPTIKDKPQQVPHVNYPGIQHLTYCYGPITIQPGQNIIRFNSTKPVPAGARVHHQVRPRPRLHERHGAPRGRAPPSPRGLDRERQSRSSRPARRSRSSRCRRASAGASTPSRQLDRSTTCSTTWSARPPASTSSGGSTSSPTRRPAAASMRRCSTRWMGVAGPSPRVGISSPIYPGVQRPAGDGRGRPLHVPRPGHGRRSATSSAPAQTWTPDHPVTLIGTVGHLHPGGLETSLRVRRGRPAQDALQLQGPLLRAGRRGVVGRRDGRHAPTGASSCRPATAERPRDLRRRGRRTGTR